MSILDRLSDHVLETSEQMMRVVEEGAALMMGNLPEDGGNKNDGPGGSATPNANVDFDEEFPEDMLDSESPLNGIAEDVMKDIMSKQSRPETLWDNIQAFKSAIQWDEKFIMSILAFHALIIMSAVIVTRKGSLAGRLSLLGVIAVMVRSAEYLNRLGAEHWESFATQNYFDDKGIFVSLMLSGPLLVISFGMLIAFLREASSLLIQVKRHELREKQRKTNTKGGKGKKDKKKNRSKQE